MKHVREKDITIKLLFHCYECPDNARCDTEAKCIACWEGGKKACKEETTEELLRLYAM